MRIWKVQDILWLRSLHIVLDADVLFRNISQRLRWRQLGQLHDMRWLSSWKVPHWMQRHIRRCMHLLRRREIFDLNWSNSRVHLYGMSFAVRLAVGE